MKRSIVWLIILLMGTAVIGGWFVMNESYEPTSFVVDGELFLATVENGRTLILNLDHSEGRKEWSILSETNTFASDYHTITPTTTEFHIIALNDGEGKMVFQCAQNDGTTDKYMLALLISRHRKNYLQIDSVSFTECE